MRIQSIKNLPIISESVTVDITPVSRYGGTYDIAKITANIRLAQPLSQDTKFILPSCDGISTPKIYLPNGEKEFIGDFDPTAEEDINQLPDQLRQALASFIDNPTSENLQGLMEFATTYSEYRYTSQTITIPANQTYVTFSYSKYIDRDEASDTHKLETIVPLTSFTLQNTPGSRVNIIVLMPFEIQNSENILEAKWIAPGGVEQQLDRTSQAGRLVLSQYWQYDPSVVIRYKY